MADKVTTFDDIKKAIAHFNKERDWEQFHNAKDLSMALSVEAAELMEIFLWVRQNDGSVLEDNKEHIKQEIADVVVYAMSFCIATGIDISDAIKGKMELNAKKYPADKCRGLSDKYSKYMNE